MTSKHLTIKQLTQEVGGGLTPRMVRHYHQLGLLPEATRSSGNYRLYTDADVQQLRRILALKSQGFQLEHIREFLNSPEVMSFDALASQLQQQYNSVTEQLARLRQTASALEEFLERDKGCQANQLQALEQLKKVEIESAFGLQNLEQLWHGLDATCNVQPEDISESLQKILPDLSKKNEIERDLLSKLVFACGDVSLVNFVKLSKDAIVSARHNLKADCEIVADVSPVVAALDHTRIAHLGAKVNILIDDPHIHSVDEAERKFWQDKQWFEKLKRLTPGCILVIGYAPSVLISALELIEQEQLKPSLIIGMPIGFNHAPAAKRRLMHSRVEYITTIGTLGGGLLAAVALNALVGSLIEKPDCHCYLSHRE
ncbi:precorrin-8X methylmutase [Plectonema cf. radiosum LEGE 06105]|uniref:Precorrin-8X methylmutase n=1 Tax=Plectonema cf. radiosum LEGE 06105 TaxID=945769 RepID=A0A8J7F6W6_9CYAN|nr:precorrin-8X methylmutase [Plectonema radiosum]MBE9216540.1 precorrin-8X methylmutase [Plectonema cf. radiosum LEGE 06105]